MKHLILLFLTMTLTGCGMETIASMPIEPEDTAEAVYEPEEHPLAAVDEIMSTKGIGEPLKAEEKEVEIETQDEPELVAEETVEEQEEPEEAVGDADIDAESEGDYVEGEVLDDMEEDVAVNTTPEPVSTYYGNCRITFYCSCSACCGEYAGGPTASGAMPTAGWTVANGSLPFGTQVIIDGHTYCVEDRGVSGDQFDIYVSDHQEALNRGLYYTDVYLVG